MAQQDSLPAGVWPVMLTPFHADGGIDWEGLAGLVDWYIESGVTGLFAVCLSSEMYELTPDERLRLARAVVAAAAGRVPVVATGTFTRDAGEQVETTLAMAETGVAGVVGIANAFAQPDEDEAIWRDRTAHWLASTGSTRLGLYECPLPDWRLLATESLAWAAQTGRMEFMKDTCCDAARIEERLAATHGTALRLYNANLSTLLPSLQSGVVGFSGTIANFCPELVVWLCDNWREHPTEAARLQSWLTLTMRGLKTNYLVLAKTYLAMRGLPIGPTLRRDVAVPTTAEDLRELTALAAQVDDWHATLGLATARTLAPA